MLLTVLNKNCYLTKFWFWSDVENLVQILYMPPKNDSEGADLVTTQLESAIRRIINLLMRDLH